MTVLKKINDDLIVDDMVYRPNLTEKWNKGKLPDGDYYIKRRNGDTLYDNIDSHGVWRNSIDEAIIEVLGRVPSCELWKAVHEQWKVLLEENTKLKDLLKECKLAIFDYPPYDLASDKIRLQIKIDKVLGEE